LTAWNVKLNFTSFTPDTVACSAAPSTTSRKRPVCPRAVMKFAIV